MDDKGEREELAQVDQMIEENLRRSQWFCVKCGKESSMYGHSNCETGVS